MDPARTVEGVVALLRDERATKRREGIKGATLLFDSPDVLRLLDANRQRLPRDAKELPVATWPALGKTVEQCIMAELRSLAGKKRGLDASVSKLFKRFVQAAEDGERRSGACMKTLLSSVYCERCHVTGSEAVNIHACSCVASSCYLSKVACSKMMIA